MDIYPQIDPGYLGPEESAVYAAVVAGYFVGGLGVARAVTGYQEWKEKDLEYTRPFLTPLDGLKKARQFLEGEEEGSENRVSEGLKMILDDEE